ncbi:MAG TPA: VWA domain-containing protein [Tepidisphaeraceae bacterium]|nr:VWA domain-containing protein [Tepidisphaeraceae bacterium]
MTDTDERLRRWRLILGGNEADGIKFSLSASDDSMDRALAALYDAEKQGGARGASGKRSGGLGASMPSVARWLGDIRSFFPSSVVRVMQQDAMERLNLRQMLLEPEMLETVEPDVHLVADLLSLSGVMPGKTKQTARIVVRKCVEEIERRLANPLRQAVNGALNRSARNRRPRHSEIDWNRTIRANLRHYQPEYKTIVPEQRIGFGRKRSSLRDIILCIDQSGSMATSVVYSGIFGAVLASLPAVRTHVVVFDTAVVDLSDKLSDPVEVLFGTQLGGGTDINRALGYCQGLIRQPSDTILILISDLIEGGVRENLLKRAAAIIGSGVHMITLLALSDDGAPMYDHQNAAALAALGSPAFACTPDMFPDLIGAAIQRIDIATWAAAHDISTAGGATR